MMMKNYSYVFVAIISMGLIFITKDMTLFNIVRCTVESEDVNVLGRGDTGPCIASGERRRKYVDFFDKQKKRNDEEEFESELRRLDIVFRAGIEMISEKLDVMLDVMKTFAQMTKTLKERDDEKKTEEIIPAPEEPKPEVQLVETNDDLEKPDVKNVETEDEKEAGKLPVDSRTRVGEFNATKGEACYVREEEQEGEDELINIPSGRKSPSEPGKSILKKDEEVKTPQTSPKPIPSVPASPEKCVEKTEPEQVENELITHVPEFLSVLKDGKTCKLPYDSFMIQSTHHYIMDLKEDLEREISIISKIIIPGLEAAEERATSGKEAEYIEKMIHGNEASLKEEIEELCKLNNLDQREVKNRIDEKVLSHLNSDKDVLKFEKLADMVRLSVDKQQSPSVVDELEFVLEEAEEAIEDDISDFMDALLGKDHEAKKTAPARPKQPTIVKKQEPMIKKDESHAPKKPASPIPEPTRPETPKPSEETKKTGPAYLTHPIYKTVMERLAQRDRKRNEATAAEGRSESSDVSTIEVGPTGIFRGFC
ncbi:hypothetical protein SLOPH_2241 [Spraguea lophii 42_110]|uniref:Uncharacterized protein n=1 Tax=Spraguea lophii (strain 42_110) TaxID=1358809 RepID=S7WA57_SPRLO|nr:hypothetical protein SLOPH_2241 [Spraguea lophii 42_110]